MKQYNWKNEVDKRKNGKNKQYKEKKNGGKR